MKAPFHYWAVVGPGDQHPELFFRSKEWAIGALESTMEEHPKFRGQIKLIEVHITYEVVS